MFITLRAKRVREGAVYMKGGKSSKAEHPSAICFFCITCKLFWLERS